MAFRPGVDRLIRERLLVTSSGFAWLVLASIATLPFFWFGLERLPHEWARPEYRFKPLVPAFSLFFFLQVLRSLPPQDVADRTHWLGLAGIGGALLLSVLGNLVGIIDFVFVAIIAWIAALVVLCFGMPRALLFWAPVLSLLLAIPWPQFVMAAVHGFLQNLAAGLGIALLRVARVSFHWEGQLVDFGTARISLNEATAGLVNFLPVMLVFFFFATAYRGPLWTRLLPLVLAAPTLIVLAALKIGALGIAHAHGGDRAADAILRFGGEWTIFAICVLVLLGLVLGLRYAIEGSIQHRFDLNVGALLVEATRVTQIRATPPIVAAAVLTALSAVVFTLAPARPTPAIERASLALFPLDIAGWQASVTGLTPGVAGILAADDYINLDYHNRYEQAPVNLWVAYYGRQAGDYGGIHSPEVCLPNDGWNIVSFRTVTVPLDGTTAGQVDANRALIRRNGETALVYYWFEGRGRRLANERLAKILVKFDGVIKGRTDGALVRYVTPVLPGEDEAEAEARLLRLMRETVDRLPRFVPP